MAKYKTVLHSIDIKNKKTGLKLLGASTLCAAILILIGCIFDRIAHLFGSNGMGGFLLRFVVIIAGFALCLVACEVLKRLLLKKLVSDIATGELSIKGYARVNLLPVLVMGILLTILMIALPHKFFWVVYIMQTVNLSAAVSDAYVLYLAKKYKGTHIIQNADKIEITA